MKKLVFSLLAVFISIHGLAEITSYENTASKIETELINSNSSELGSKAAGDTISVIPWTDYFDNYGTGTSVFPPKWTKNTTYADHPYVNTGGFSGNCLYFFAARGTYNIATLPPIDPIMQINSLRLNFKYKTFEASDTLKIGVMTDPNNELTWSQVGFVVVPSTGTWYDAEVSLAPYQGTGRYIAFKIGYTNAHAYAYLDNLEVSYIPACAKPTNITFSNITTTSADMTWTPGNSADIAWWIYYKSSLSSDWDSVYSIVDSYSFTNLLPSSAYNVEIKTDCGVELSEPSFPVVFRTSCGEISNFPWSENFDTYGGVGTAYYPACWSKITTYSYYPYLNGTYNSPPASLYFNATSWNYNIAILPAITYAVPVNTLSLNFKLYKASAANNIIVGVMTDTANVSTFDSICLLSPSAINSWETFNVELSNYTGTGKYIAFKVQGASVANAMFLDDLVIYETSSCAMPSGLTHIDSLITPNSITLDWDGTDDLNVTSWIVNYKPVDDNAWQSISATKHPFEVPNLKSSVVYEFKILSVCINADTTFTSNSINVGMPCQPITIYPWNEGFESDWHPALGVNNAAHPWCWTNIDGGASKSYNWRKVTTGSYIRTGGGALQMYSGNNYGEFSDWIITPVFTLTGNERLQFWASSYSTYTDEFNIQILNVTTNGVFDSVADTSHFTIIMPNTQQTSDVWKQYEVGLNQFIGNYQIAFVKNTPGGFHLNIDDVSISPIPQCTRPTTITLANLTSTSVDISWIPGDQADVAWWVYHREAGYTAWDSVYITLIPVTINNLNPNTEYEVEIRTDCGYKLSLPSIPENFRTLCAPISSIPYSESFDTYGGTGSTYFPDCWSKITTFSSYPFLNATNHSSPASLYFNATSGTYNLAILHKIDQSIPLDTLVVSFWLRANNTDISCIVGIMDSLNDADSFIPIKTLNPSSTNTWEKFEVYLNTYSGNGRNIAFKSKYTTRTNNFYLDDVVIDYIDACPPPVNLVASNITASGADISWAPSNSYSSWWLYYKESSATDFDSVYVTGVVIHRLNNLVANSEYTYYLKTDCNTGFSKDTPKKTFRTACMPISSLPYTENFDNLGGTGSNYYPNCWTKITTYSTYPYPSTANNSSPYSLYFYATSGTYNLAILHEIDQSIPMNNLMISFWMRKGNATSNLIVGIMDSLDNPATFTPIDTVAPSATVVWESFELFTNTYTGTGRYIAFKSEYNSTTNYSYLDDVVIDYIPACPKPVQLNASYITASTADISWLPVNQATSNWWLYYKESSAINYDSVYVSNATTYTLTNLIHSSLYDYYLVSDCGTEISLPSRVENFFTQCVSIYSFPWIEGFENTWIAGTALSNDDAPNQCWVNINGGASTSYKWRKSTNSTVPSYVRTGSGAAQLYASNQSMGDYLMTPVMTFTGNEQLNFWGKGYSSTSKYAENLWVKAYDVTTNGDIDSYSDTTLFTNLAFINDTNCYTWNEYEIPLANLVGDYRLVFARNNSVGYYYQLDDLMVDKMPACPRPSSASASNMLQSSADIAWIAGSPSDNSWKIYYRSIGDQVWDSIITQTNPHTLSGLSPSTEYEVGIATDCGNAAFSNMKIIKFRTACGLITKLPWTDNFDSYGTGTSVFPDCWTKNSTQTDRPYVNTTNFSPPGSLYFNATSGNYNIAATPAFDQSINISNLKATFKYRNTNATDILLVGVMTDPNVDSTLVIIDTITAPTTSAWYNYNIDFSSYTGTGQYIAFRIDYTTTTCNGYIDNLEISYNLVCNDPTSLIANNITTTSADITWNAGGTETSWQIKQGESGNLIDLINNTYQATGLSLNTNYTFYVRSNCGNNIYSSWVPVTFTTLNLPVNPVVETSNITVFTHNTARFTGSYTQGLDTIIEVGFNYKEQTASIWINESITPVATPFNFDASGLTPNTSYKVIAYATTSAGTFYGDTATFTTNQLLPPNVTTDTVIVDNTDKSAKFEGTTSQGTYAIIARGFEYKISSADWSTAIDLTATGSANITATATSLKVDKYNVRAYAETGEGKTYGGILDFEIVSSLNSIEGNSLEVNLYPNPASNEATLSIKGVNGKANIIITDVQGRAINTFDKEGILGEIKHSLDLSNYAKGVYYIRIQNSNSIKTQKLIVQ